MSFKIYTKTGDKGETGLFGGRRLPKSHLRIDAYGTVDELNSYIGLVRDSTKDEKTRDVLYAIQNRLFTLGSNLASDPEKSPPVPDLVIGDIELLEKEMDRMDEDLPALKNFILPGGHPLVSHTHVARCICRRAERLTVALSLSDTVPEILIQYLNRLSDYLFILSRYFASQLKVEEVTWKGRDLL